MGVGGRGVGSALCACAYACPYSLSPAPKNAYTAVCVLLGGLSGWLVICKYISGCCWGHGQSPCDKDCPTKGRAMLLLPFCPAPDRSRVSPLYTLSVQHTHTHTHTHTLMTAFHGQQPLAGSKWLPALLE